MMGGRCDVRRLGGVVFGSWNDGGDRAWAKQFFFGRNDGNDAERKRVTFVVLGGRRRGLACWIWLIVGWYVWYDA